MAFILCQKNRKPLLILGFCMICLGGFFLIRTALFLHGAARAQGRIVGMKGDSPVLTFTDQNGKIHSFESHVGAEEPSYREGDSVTIIYDPHEPKKAVLDSFFDIWALTLVFALIGFSCIFSRLIIRFGGFMFKLERY